MAEPIIKSGWDMVLFGGPMVAMLLLWFFSLDEIVSPAKRRERRHAALAEIDLGREPEPSDPDGRPWPPPTPRRLP